jgi:hypothetical protein
MRKIIEALERSRKSHLNAISKAESLLKKKVGFDFFIIYQESDGFVMMYEDSYHYLKKRNLCKVLEVIEAKGILTLDDYIKLSI